MSGREPPYERMLRLAAFVVDRRHGCTREDIRENVPGYGDLSDDALEKALQRDRATLATSLGIRLEWSDEEQQYTITPPYFTPAERTALLAAAAVVDVEGVGDDLAPGELGGSVAREAARIVVRLHDHVITLRDAIAARQPVRFRYHGRVRTVEPYAVGMWRNRWYTVGREIDVDALRKYRLDRVEVVDGEAAIVVAGAPDSFSIPEDFDAVAELRMDPNDWGTDPPLTARVRVARDQVPTFLADLAGNVVDTDADTATIELIVRDYASFVVRVLGFGTGARVIEPPELVERVWAWLAPQAEAV